MSSNSAPTYHISHESGIQIIPDQNKTFGNAFIFPSSDVLQSPVIRRECP